MNTRKRASTRSAAASARTTAITLAALLLATVRPAAGLEATAGAPGEWMSSYSTARTLALGGAYVAVADDPLGVLWNPAGLSAMDQNELRFENARLFEDTSINGFGFAVPGSWLPSFGLTMLSLGSGEFQRTNDLNDPLGTFRNTETAYLFTMSKAFSRRFAIGTNLKLVQQSVEDFSAGGFGVDVGGWYHLTPYLRLGAAVSNLAGPTITLRDVAETYPLHLRGGAALQVLDGRGLVTAQLDQSEGMGTRMHAGAEYWIGSGMALRVGFDNDYETGGFSYRFAPRYQLDYGVADQALGLTHRVGLSYRFGGFFASSHAEPAVFSPTGEKAVTRIALDAHTKAAAEVWTLDIVSKGAEVVRRFSGNGQPPAHIEWDGKDETGLPLADGVYRYCLTVKDHEGRELVAHTRAIEIFTSGPQGEVPVIPVGQQTQEPLR